MTRINVAWCGTVWHGMAQCDRNLDYYYASKRRKNVAFQYYISSSEDCMSCDTWYRDIPFSKCKSCIKLYLHCYTLVSLTNLVLFYTVTKHKLEPTTSLSHEPLHLASIYSINAPFHRRSWRAFHYRLRAQYRP